MGESQPIHAGEMTGGQKKGRKGKIRLGRACKGCSYNPNIAEQNGGVKKEQVKGCGSVNRPTPGSQRPAEPVAPGFLQGVKIPKNRGRFSVLGVKLWVVDARFSQRRAILYGVTIGVTAISCFEQGKQSARLSAEHNWRGCLACRLGRLRTVPTGDLRPRTPLKSSSFPLYQEGCPTSKTAPHKQRKEILKTPRPRQV